VLPPSANIFTSPLKNPYNGSMGARDEVMEIASPPAGNLKEDVLREQVSLVYSQLPAMQTSSFIVALILGFAVRDHISHTSIFLWLALIFAIASGRAVLHFKFSKVRREPFNPHSEIGKDMHSRTALDS
jgi:hypothetical protein